MRIEVSKLTDLGLLRGMINECDPSVSDSQMTLKNAYKRQHSIIRTQLFYIKMLDIPSFVSVHLVRHGAVGQYHYVSSNRSDWTGSPDTMVTRESPVNHMMILNAQHLIDICKVRLCGAAHVKTRNVVEKIREEVLNVDEDLANMLVPQCYYYGYCPEVNCCGKVKRSIKWRLRNYVR